MRPRLDPELGVVASAKKDDDLYARGGRAPGGGGGSGGGWRAKGAPRVPPRKTFKRLGLLLLLAAAVYVFIRNIPTDLGPQDKRHPFYTYPGVNAPPGSIPKAAPPGHGDLDNGQGIVLPARNYDGAVRFLELAETLHAIGATKGQQQINKNVLFMASSIKSAGILLPIACQMGKELRAYVHFALISRVEVPFQQLQDIHGITDDCHILFHGTRSLGRCCLDPTYCCFVGLVSHILQMPVLSSRAFPRTIGLPSLSAVRSTISTIICTHRPLWSTLRKKNSCFSERCGSRHISKGW